MESITRLSVDLPKDVADSVRARVASGAYASESDVVSDGLALLAEQDGPLAGWVQTALATGYDAWRAEPSDVATLDAAAARLEEESASRRAQS